MESSTPTDQSPAVDPLTNYLAASDAACPKCRYNLRGVQSGKCPECGSGLSLTLARRARLGGYGLFLLLAFGWLAASGTMNTVRNGRSAWDAAHTSQWFQTLGVNINTGPITIRRTAPALAVTPLAPMPPIVISSPSAPGTATAPTIAQLAPSTGIVTINGQALTGITAPSGVTALSLARPGVISRPALAASGGSTNWGAVSIESWVRLGWSSLLALGGLLGLILIARYARRDCPPALQRFLVRGAVVLFALYAGAHLYWFTIEQIA